MWWIGWAVIAALWANVAFFHGLDWPQIGLGFFTGAMLSNWAIEMTGNKVPDSWRKGAGAPGNSASEKQGTD